MSETTVGRVGHADSVLCFCGAPADVLLDTRDRCVIVPFDTLHRGSDGYCLRPGHSERVIELIHWVDRYVVSARPVASASVGV